MEGTVAQTQPLNERPHDKARFVYRGLTVPFMLLAFCFAAWGSAANLADVMVGVFRHIFVISNARSALIQTAYYGGYFSLAIPRPSSTSGSGYKTRVLTGLGVAALRAGSGGSRRRARPGE
jgi:FHS family L-fucose permease-like MFS transporter